MGNTIEIERTCFTFSRDGEVGYLSTSMVVWLRKLHFWTQVEFKSPFPIGLPTMRVSVSSLSTLPYKQLSGKKASTVWFHEHSSELENSTGALGQLFRSRARRNVRPVGGSNVSCSLLIFCSLARSVRKRFRGTETAKQFRKGFECNVSWSREEIQPREDLKFLYKGEGISWKESWRQD